MLPKHADGIAFLFGSAFSEALQAPAERAAVLFQVTEEEAIEEFRRLLAIKTFKVDEDATNISPTPLSMYEQRQVSEYVLNLQIVDELWHAAILNTKFYADLQAALGFVLHHRPSGASPEELEPRTKRLAIMKAIYNTFFGSDPLQLIPLTMQSHPQSSLPQVSGPHLNEISVLVMTPMERTIRIRISKQATIEDVKRVIQDSEGHAPDQQRLILNHLILDDHRSLEGCHIEDHTVLHVVYRLRGC